MLSLNSVSAQALTALTPNSATQGQPQVKSERTSSESAVVNVQSKLQESAVGADLKLDAGSARQMAADLAALLSGGQGMSTQANINSFDAAALLA